MRLNHSDAKLSVHHESISDQNLSNFASEKATGDDMDASEHQKSLVDNSTVTRPPFSPLLRQTLAASGPLLATVCSGLTTGYSAILLPQLRHNDSSITITPDEGSWIASMAALPMALGCILAGVMMEWLGRRMTNIMLSVGFLVGWVIISFATSIIHLLIGRFITGICVGMLGPPCSVYIAETSHPKYRGIFLAIISFSISLGILIAHILGTFLSWELTATICACAPIICVALMVLVPETPNYLASKGKFKEAEASFRWLRGNALEDIDEMDELLNKHKLALEMQYIRKKSLIEGVINADQIDYTVQNADNKNTEIYMADKPVTEEKKPSMWRKFGQSYFWKPLFIINAFFAITQFSGVNAIAFYSVDIIKTTLKGSVNSYLVMAIIDIIRLVMSIVACVLLRRFTRRSLAIVSTAATAASLIFLMVFTYFKDEPALRGLEYIGLIGLIGYICVISVGLVPLPWVMVGEVFPSSVRSVGSGLSSCMCFVYFFCVVKTAPVLFENAEIAYGIYGAVAVVGCIFLFKFLPETKDKTLEEIEANFVSKSAKK